MRRLPSLLGLCAIMAGAAAPALAEGDPERGESAFRPCRACHMVGEGAVSRVGPHLNGIVGRQAAAVEGFRYSRTLRDAGEAGLVWTEAELDEFMAAPRDYLPGISMVFRGLSDPQDRADVIAYLIEEGGGRTEVEAAPANPEVEAILALEADPAYGAYLSSECTSCHRPEGGEDIPSIAGLEPHIFVAGLVGYRSGERQHQVMNTITARLGDAEIAALAAYFESVD